ncbi:cation:proton antiporter [Rhizobium paranaense]|uniref:Kef-type K+ transport system membrane component KefB/nucleotide-binding universal stress UspA family protein n=1 Tax=Rhizobium paranaense TaxID=1650438 RepID=A0A7W8XUI9_9HYPH|nr:cation:proton antiporter [Rhizobium paranaense]MBB5575858.1 Kef-type K+ transport system membrane component KefB/nucleotide-binding universal stress UspA family protein [Rhizobium paranaense]
MRSMNFGKRYPGSILIGLLLCAAVATSAFAANGESAATPSEGLFLTQIIVLVVVGRLLGELMVRIGQPSIMGQIIGGVLLGPSVLGEIWPDFQAVLFPAGDAQKGMINAVAQLGILFLLLLAGMETDLGLARRMRRAAFGISFTGIVVPFAAGFALGELLPDSLLPDPEKRLVASLFLGTALSISSVKIVASVVREMDFMRRNIGQLIVASAIIDDTVGWVIISVTFSLAEKGAVELPTLAKSVIGTLVFMGVSFTIGRRVVFEIIRWTNDRFKSDLPVLSAIVAVMGIMAIITNLIGVHTVLGAFVAGILVGQSPILTRQIDTQLRALTTALFMPVFFGLTGLQTDLTVLRDPAILLLASGLIVIASIGKFGGAFLGGRFGGFSTSEAIALGCGMNARGSTEVIVASIGLSVGVLDQRLFSIIVAMAVVTTMLMPPTLRWALARLPVRPEEQNRLESEEFEKASYLAKFERILLAVDRSKNANLASRISGFLAAVRQMPVTVLRVDDETEGQPSDERSDADGLATFVDQVKATATKAVAQSDADSATSTDVHVTARKKSGDLERALSESAEKGHDLMIIGAEPAVADAGGLAERFTKMTSSFQGTVAITFSRGRLPENDNELRILIPVSGTERSTRAVEFASAIAKAAGCEIAVVYVTDPQQLVRMPRLSDMSDLHREAFKRVDEIAAYYDLDIRKTVQRGASPELAILRNARQRRANLIVLGVSRQAGTRLSYGGIANSLIDAADRSIVVIEAEK